MPASYDIRKVSGVIRISSTVQGSAPSKSYFGSVGKFSNNGNTIFVTIGGDSYEFQYTDIQVNGQTPSTLSTALTLLTSIFGS